MKQAYIEKNFREVSLALIDTANSIIADWQAQGYTLTLRQLYYQFVARDYIENTKQSYDRLGSLINDARLAGLIDWSAIEDRTRNLEGNVHWETPQELIDYYARRFKIDKWEGQEYRVEVWIEKEALVGVIDPICRNLDIDFFACRGYVSQSEVWTAGQRFLEYRSQGQQVLILHLGDHDPSGVDMTRDNQDRLDMFTAQQVEVKRIALNMDQIEQYNPPPNPAKLTDSRCTGYVEMYGDSSWELDALEPSVLSQLIIDEVEEVRDDEMWNELAEKEERHREDLLDASSNWEDVLSFLADI